ncbi:MAG: DUF2125 domain-containing protein [Magnetospirillum sp.]|nr:DUF2125 domain-containing protein [Magnetospirillum sp.]
MRKILWIAGGVGVVGVALWTGVWLYAARHIETRLAQWQQDQAAAGVALDWQAGTLKGWPFGWRLELERPQAAGAGPAGWRWSGDRLVARLDPRDLAHVSFRLPGEQKLNLGRGDLAVAADLRAANPLGSLRFDDQGRVAELKLDLETVELQVGTNAPWSARRVAATLAPHRPDVPTSSSDMLDLTATIDALRLPAPIAAAAVLGRDIKRFGIQGRLEGPVRGASLAQALTAWRDAGGAVQVTALALEWGNLRLNGDATLALDEQSRPLGAGTLRIAGAGETLDALAQSGTIDARNAAMLKIALAFLARNDPNNGGAPTVQIPFAAQDGALSVHRFRLLSLRPLAFE